MGMFDWLKREQKSYTTPELEVSRVGGNVVWTDWSTETAVKEGFEASVWVNACIELRSKAAASVPWVAQRRTADGWEDAPDSPLQALINSPNPAMRWPRLIRYAVQHLDLAGAAYWTKIRAGQGRLPRELWPQNPASVRPVRGRESLIAKFEYVGGQYRDIPVEDMVYLQNANPADFVAGHPTLRSAGTATDIDREAEAYQKATLANRGLTDYAVVLDKDTTPEQLAALKSKFDERHTGSANARRAMFTNRDVKLLSQTAAEMDYVESRKFIRSEICTAFGVPEPMVGIYENATLANIETARKIFWLDTMVPLLEDIEHQLLIQLAADFGPEWRVTYDLTAVQALQENYHEKAQTAEILLRIGVPLNEINKRLDLGLAEDLPGGDIAYLSAGLIPVGETPDEPEERSLPNEVLRRLAYGPDQ